MATKKDGLYKKRYKTLKEHRAAVKARKLMEQKGGKNVGPVSAGAEYGRKLAKPKKKEAPRPKVKAGGNKTTPKQTTPEEAKSRFYSSSSQGSIAKNQEKAKRNFFRGSRGGAPKRSDFPAGRAGQASYAAAKRRYEKGDTPTRRGRLTTAQRRAARRGRR
tara:strand:+ start:110 stop:592 length:483 start_codon:yes stop_codon:yes gene_type:complete